MADYISKHTGEKIDAAVTAFLTGGGVSSGDGGAYVFRPAIDSLQDVLESQRHIYFPSGTYNFSNVLIDRDTVLELAPDAHFHVDAGCMLRAYNCSLTIRGGIISSGTKYDNRHLTFMGRKNEDETYEKGHESRKLLDRNGIIALYGCHDCLFEQITVPYSSSPSVIQIYGDSSGEASVVEYNGEKYDYPGYRAVTIDGNSVVPGACRNIRINNCSFNDFLLSAVHVLYHNKGIVIDGCTFTNALRPVKANLDPYGYCYTAYTGVQDITIDKELYFTPTDGYVFRNCRVENCEGTGVDTHAASNVLYENNTFIDCDNFITAYHDYKRVRTADGWVMENIIVRNNRCKTTKTFDYEGNLYPHNPFMLHNNGPMHTMRNLVVENNVIETNFYYKSGSYLYELIALYFADDVMLRNNTIISNRETAYVSYVHGCNNVLVDNLTLVGTYECALYLETSVCKIGAIDCSRATFSNAVLCNRNDEFYCSVVDTDDMRITNAEATAVTGWEWVLNRYGKPLMAADSYVPFDGVTLSTDKGYTGKANSDAQTIRGVGGDRLWLSATLRFPIGTCVAVSKDSQAAKNGPFYYIVDVESYYDDTNVRRFNLVLDRELEDGVDESAYVRLAVPQYGVYENPSSGGSSGGSGAPGADGEDGGYYTPSVTQTSDTTMQVSFAASDADMPSVASVNVTLPKGPKGDTGATGATGPAGQNGKDGKDGSNGQPGADGKDGTSVTHAWNGTTLTITSASGTSSANLKGDKGDPGKDGTPVTVKSVSESSADGGSNVMTFSDGSTMTVKNGSKGSTGAAGKDGNDGKTPVKGTDYFTAAEKTQFVADVTAGLATIQLIGIDENDVQHTWTLYGKAN